MALSRIFDTSRRSLLAYQKALSVTANNVANANNADYSRQRTNFSSVAPDVRGKLSIGNGVQISDIERIRNGILDKQIRDYSENQSFSQKQAGILGSIEALFSEPTEQGLSNMINKFFNSWNNLSVDPTSIALRNSVVNATQQMTGKLENIYEGINSERTDLQKDAENLVGQINNYTKDLKEVNKQIYESSVINNDANDLLDKRDKILKSLSQIVNTQVNIDANGVANVSIGGVFAVDRLHQIDFQVETNQSGKFSVLTEDGNARVTIRKGELYADYNTVNNLIPEYKNQLDTFAYALKDNVNAEHKKGYSLTDSPTNGIEFFSSYSDGVLKVNSDILKNVKKIAVSSDGTDGNNDIAINIAKLQEAKIMDGNTVQDGYQNLVTSVASEKQFQSQNNDTFSLVLSNLEQQQSSVAGVSIDEEMTDILKYQRSYDASAKLITVADQMLQTILRMV